LEALLAQPGWTVRILTKNAAVADDFDLIKKYRDRVLVGISLTGTRDKEDILSVIEPNASPISERIAALKKAHRLGLRTYGMLCPLLPGVADAPKQIDTLVRLVKGCGAEEVFSEAVNPRGNGLVKTEEALRKGGFIAEAEAVSRVRQKVNWSPYVVGLIRNLQKAMRKHMSTRKLRFLLYPSGLLVEDLAKVEKDRAGVIWLGK
jgi:DNA repair photolyase